MTYESQSTQEVQSNDIIEWAKRGTIIGFIILLLLGVIPVVLIPFFFGPEGLAVYRDGWLVVSSIFLLVAAFIAVVLLVTIIYIVQAINMQIQTKVLPAIETTTNKVEQLTGKVDDVLDNTKGIVGNVRESSDTITTTTVFAAEQIVSPIIRVSSLMAGVRAAAGVLARRDVPTESSKAETDGESFAAARVVGE